jgi:hypothetical protein
VKLLSGYTLAGTFFLILWGGTTSLGTAATSGLLYKRQMMRVIVEHLVE